MKKNSDYDTKAFKQIPILRVAEALGLNIIKTGSDTWAERDPEIRGGTTSLTLFIGTNTFVRFSGKVSGGVSKGDNIALVMHVRNDAKFRSACSFLSRL